MRTSKSNAQPDVRAWLAKLDHELTWAWLEWRVFEETFTRRTKPLLQRCGAGFFEVVHLAIQRDVVMALARLTDASSTGKFENLSIPALAEALAPEQRERIVRDLKNLDTDAAVIRRWRTKVLAHADRPYALGIGDRLPGLSRPDVRRMLRRARTILTTVGEMISPHNGPAGYAFYPDAQGPKKLIRVLRQATSTRRAGPS